MRRGEKMNMANSVTEEINSAVLARTSPFERPDFVLQVLDMKSVGTKITFRASDGKMTRRAVLLYGLESEVTGAKIQNSDFFRVLNPCNVIPWEAMKLLTVAKCEVVSLSIGEDSGTDMKPEQELRSELKEDKMIMEKLVTQDVISALLADTNRLEVPNFVIQVLDMKSVGTKIRFRASDGKMTLRAVLRYGLASEVTAAKIQNSDLILVLDYSCNVIPEKAEKHLIVFKCKVVSKREEIEAEIESEVKSEERAPTPMAMTGGVHHLASPPPDPCFESFPEEEVLSISEGTIETRANAVQNDCVLTVDEYSEVEEEASNDAIPETEVRFVPIDQLHEHVNSKDLVDVIGVVLNVYPTMSFPRKRKKAISKCDITIADETKKTVLVSLRNELAGAVCQELVSMSDTSPPVVAITSCQVSEFKFGDIEGIFLTSLSENKSIAVVNPEISESRGLRSWFEIEGKEVRAEIRPTAGSATWSIHTDSPPSTHINSFGEEEEGHAFHKKLKSETSASRPL